MLGSAVIVINEMPINNTPVLSADSLVVLGLTAGTANQQLSEHASTLEEKLHVHEEEVSALRSECNRLRAVVVQRTGPATFDCPLVHSHSQCSLPELLPVKSISQ